MGGRKKKQYGDEWKRKVDTEAEVLALPITFKGVSGDGCRWRCLCPFHNDTHASASITIRATGDSEPGHFTCEVCPPGKGQKKFGLNLLGLIAKLKPGINTYDKAFHYLREKYFPKDTLLKSQTEQVDKLPDADVLKKSHDRLLNESDDHAKIAMDYLRGRFIADRKLLEELEIGYNNRELILPMRDEQGVLQNVEYRNIDQDSSKKVRRVKGRPVIPYPLWLIDLKSKRRVICEGATDLMTCWAMGDRDAITIGGAGMARFFNLRPYLPTGEGAQIYVALDNDDKSKVAARDLTNDLLNWGENPEQVVKITDRLPEGCDINDWATECRDIGDAADRWKLLLSAAPVRTQADHVEFGLAEVEGRLVGNSSGEVVAQFTGKAIQTGRERLGGEVGDRFYRLRLKHPDGDTIDVYHPIGRQTLEVSIQQSPGKVNLFKFQHRHDDQILTFIIRATGEDLKVKDHGWVFGEDDESKSQMFHTPGIAFTHRGAVPQTFIEYEAPHTFFDNINLPMPDASKAQEALRLFWEHAYRSHLPSVMAPLLSSALLAPIRKRYFKHQPRFPILVYGASGAGKTSRCRIVQTLLGDFSDENSILSWRSTSKAIEHITSIAGDMWVLVDEMQIDKLSQLARFEAFEFLKSIPQGIARTRMKSTGDGFTKTPPTPRSIVAITMEALPDLNDEGLLARCLLVHVPTVSLYSDPFDMHYKKVWEGQHLLQQCMALWLQEAFSEGFNERLADHYKLGSVMCKEALEEKCPMWQTVANTPRLMSRIEALTAVWYSVIDLSVKAKAISRDYALLIIKQWQKVVEHYIQKTITSYQQSGLERSYLDVVAAGLQSGACHLEPVGRAATKGWNVIPQTRGPNSKLVGYFKLMANSGPNSILYMGRQMEIALSASSSLLWGASEAGHIWSLARQYLTNANLVARNGRADLGEARIRVLWLTKNGAELFMDGVEGYGSEEFIIEPLADHELGA